MRMTTLAALVALVASAGCSYPHLYENGQIDEDYFARVEKRTAQARGIDFQKPVPHEVITAAEAKKKIGADVERDNDQADERSLLRAWQALGFLPPGEVHSLAKDEVDLTAEQAAAFYDPREKKFYVSGVTDQARGFTTGFASWVLDRDLVSEIVFSHELVHALQDQKYDLAKYDEGAAHNDDAELARRAVVEGDATYYGFFSLGLKGLDEVDLKREDMDNAGGDAWNRVPVILREELTFAYWAGNAFHKALRHGKPGGDPARDPWSEAPASTAEVLDPKKFEAKWTPAAIKLGDAPPLVGATLVRENTVGAFPLRVLLEGADDSKPEAVAATKGWKGDRYRVYEIAAPLTDNPGQSTAASLALAWRLEFETAVDADAFVHAYRLFAKTKPGAESDRRCDRTGDAGAFVVEAPDAATLAALLPLVGGR